MADKEISGLTAAAALAAADLLLVSQGGNSRKATGAQIEALCAPQPGYVSGRWYYPLEAALAAGLVGQNTIQLSPFYLQRPVTISDLGTRVSTALAANNLQLAIYGSDVSTLLPTGNALAATGDISTASAAAVSADIAGANVTLAPGLYWMAVNHSGATSISQGMSANSSTQQSFLIGSATLATIIQSSNATSFRLTVAQAYGTWPDLTAAGFTEATGGGGPILVFKVA